MEAYRGCAHRCMWCCTKAQGILIYIYITSQDRLWERIRVVRSNSAARKRRPARRHVWMLFEVVYVYVDKLKNSHEWFIFWTLFVCLFVGIKPEKLYFASCVGREVTPLGVITRRRRHKSHAYHRHPYFMVLVSVCHAATQLFSHDF